MKRSLVWMIAIAIMVTLVAGTTFAGGGKEEAPVEEMGEETKYGGRLNLGFLDGVEALSIGGNGWRDPWMGCIFWPMVYEPLWHVGPAPNYDPIPALAASWESEDGKTWIFHLQEDATWHDGVPVTAEDIAFTAEAMSGTTVWFTPSETDIVPGSIKIIDDHTIEITMASKVFSKYPPYHWVPMMPKHIWEPHEEEMETWADEKAIGSGPFMLKEFKSNQYIWLSAYEDSWRGRSSIDEMVLRTYAGEDVRAMAMRKGEIDMMGYGGSSKLLAEELKGEENLEVLVSPGILFVNLSFNLHKDTALQDINVRKAIMHGIDRDRIIEMVYLGYAEKSDGITYPETIDHHPNLPQYDYDPDLAKKILDEGGYIDTDNDGIRNDPARGKNIAFELMAPTGWADAVKIATLVKEQLNEIDIAIDIMVIDSASWGDYLFNPQDDNYEMSFDEQEPGPNGDWIWEDYRTGGAWNAPYYNNPEYDELLDKMLYEPDQTKRREYLHGLQLILAEDLPWGPLFRVNATDPVSKKFEGWVQGLGGISGWNSYLTYFNVHLK